ncbi:MAG TPA: DUF1499 domain-containing protein [Oligoflexus sp.]|uniref:DUF1499 domain-containing protein n=1 Tax=Oligoflexus sp. TaxID=1971216 RepID=UPI002D3B38DE|nr:DUF1499 domain-containing protein [Oligoflexus sp.]HYX37334.1 DUF1499 domain-containing protein [Oligoflexus sp.]
MARMSPEVAKNFLGLQKDGKLSRCPNMPNCTCSAHEDDRDHFLKPMRFKGSSDEAKSRLKSVLSKQEGFKIVEDKGNYLRVEVTSGFFKFVDDVEFHIQPAQNIIQFRSASRLGYWDFRANQKRMKNIIHLFEAAGR